MCDWKPGDEIECINADPCPVYGQPPLSVGSRYTVASVHLHADVFLGVAVALHEVRSAGPNGRFTVWRFRKVERRTDKQSLTEWLNQPSGNTDHLDKPLPAKKRERA